METLPQEKTIDRKSKETKNNDSLLKQNSGKTNNNDKLENNNVAQNNKNSKLNDEIPDAIDDLKKIRQKHFKNYSISQIIIKSLKFSSKNLKPLIFEVIKKLIRYTVDIFTPIVYSELIDSFLNYKDFYLLKVKFFRYSFLLFCNVLIDVFFELIGKIFIKNAVNEYKLMVIQNISEKDIEFFDLYQSGEIIGDIYRNETMLDSNFIFKVVSLILDIIKFIFLFIYLMNYKLIMIIYFLAELYKFVSEYLLKKFTDYNNKRKKKELFNNYNNRLNEFVSNIRLIKSFATEDYELKKLKELKSKSYRGYGAIEKFLGPLLTFTHRMADNLIIFYSGKKIINKEFSYSKFPLIQDYSNQLKREFNKIKKDIFNFIDVYQGWQTFFEIYDFEPKVISIENYIPKNEKDFKYDIEFKNVDFCYPLRPNVHIFKNLSFKINDGKTVAFVGSSGCGKSTITSLIQRFYDPCKGEILLNNKNLKNYNLKWFRKKIGYVQQEPTLSSGTIEENITYGLNEYSQEKLKEVCDLSNLDFVNDKSLFPQGIKSLVGEKGSKVSGGQKQRIAIARAIIRDIKILILDEATSALDAENEKELHDSIEKITKKKKITTIIIAHRLSTVKNADMIMLLKKGEILEAGTHDELIKNNGEYYKLVENQLVNNIAIPELDRKNSIMKCSDDDITFYNLY